MCKNASFENNGDPGHGNGTILLRFSFDRGAELPVIFAIVHGLMTVFLVCSNKINMKTCRIVIKMQLCISFEHTYIYILFETLCIYTLN